ncbi:hypothetical protein RR48_03796 [Papilio machaon]|uniref:Nucleolar protein 14 n=1 Tax=Papilio machaon TaxID=76193 RepID=A0A0N0PB75_PAPMA|nr:hypothetical protein RR48_03796 [Papilio machaon]
MAKVKNKRNSGKADKVHMKNKTEANKKKLNPFEVHINREKLKVLGKKSKHDRGLPGVSRAKAIQKRKETLGVEMKVMNKTNAFIDRRIGEKNSQLSAEDRMIARFAAERAKQHSKKNIYNLADDEILTHRGQTLEQIEKFDDPRSDDEDEEGGKRFGGLDDEFVSDGHFGGGILSKTDTQDGAKSHKDLIEQLIVESKKRKAEKQKEKEQTLDLTEKLDSEWKDLQPVVFKKARVEESLIDKLLSKADKGQDYDKMMRELKFEKRGTPSDGLKSTEKQEAEERKKLEELERQREQRMLPEEEANAPKSNPAALKHRSADDLDDNFELDDEKEFMLAYDKEGKPLVPEHVLKDFTVPNAKPKFNDGISDTSSDDEEGSEEEENEEGNESDDEDNNENEKVESENEEGNKKENSIEETNLVPNKVESEASSDEKNDDDDEEINDKRKNDEEYKKLNKPKVNGVSKAMEESENSNDESSGDDDESNKNEFDDLRDLKESEDESDDEMLEESSQKIESFFDLKSEEGANLKELLTGKSPSQQSAALEKLIKSYDPSLSENNKELLSRLFKDAYSVSRGFFVTALILEYTALSKRFVPSAVNFLRGILYLSANTSVLNPIQVVPPFRLHKDVKILNLEDDCSKVAFENKMSTKDLIRTDIDNAFKITCLLTCVLMLKEFFDNYNDLEAQEAIFEAHIKLMGRLDLDLYPKKVRSTVSEVLQHMKESLEVKTYTPLAREKVRPKALRLYEPDIQEVFTGSKSSKLSREKAEKARLQGKYKKEMKGALREIRRDKAYIASVKIRQKIHSDNIRKEKVKQIYKDASIQQGELNKLKRMK